MTYQIRNRNLYVISGYFCTEASAIKRAQEELRTDEAPLLICEGNDKVTALVFCGAVYRPEEAR